MSHDVLIVGGGIMGWSTAHHLLQADPALDVLVIEKDSSYRYASTMLSEGNVRIQFNLEENVRISQHTMAVLETFADDMETSAGRPDPAPRHEGNLFLVDEGGREAALRGLETQRALGCDVEWLDVDAIASRFAALASDGIVGGTFGPADGRVDATAMHRGYRGKARESGAGFAETDVTGILVGDRRARGVRTTDGDLAADTVLVAAGAWTPDLVRPIGIDLPVVPVMRTVYVVATAVPTAGLPGVFLPSGVYAIPEGETTWVSAWSLDSDPVGYDFTPAGRERYVEMVWPELVGHLPAFDRLHVETSWAGLYAVNQMDGNGIFGEWPAIAGLHLATGFSGHGFQQAPAVGRYLAEGILGLPHVLDLSRLGPQRVLDGTPVFENVGRLI